MGVLLGWARGSVGTQLPQTSPASENVAVLAAATIAQASITAHSDYSGVPGLENLGRDVITYRKSNYADVKF